MTLRGISLIALTALVFTGGMHAALWARRSVPQAGDSSSRVGSDRFSSVLPADSAASPTLDLTEADGPDLAPLMGFEEYADEAPDEVDVDLHPPVLAIHREFTRVPRIGMRAESNFPPKPPGSFVAQTDGSETRPIREFAEGPALPEQRTAEIEKPIHPPALPPMVDAAAEAMRRLLEKELPESTPEERRVWQEELKELPPNVVRDLMHVRRHMQGLDAEEKRMERLRPPRIASRPEMLPPPAWPRRLPGLEEEDLPPDMEVPLPEAGEGRQAVLQSTLLAVTQARDVHLNNVANARTPGFRRSVVSFEELAMPEPVAVNDADDAEFLRPAEPSAGIGIRLAAGRIDCSPGAIRETENPLDVAIEGTGFFEVNLVGQTRYTRCGRLTLDGRRRLGVRCGSAVALVQPEIEIPEDAGAVRIGRTGEVEVQSGDDDAWVRVGTLTLVRFLNPSELQPRGSALLAATVSCGAPQRGQSGRPGYGAIKSGCLEGSNVDVKSERREIQELDALWRSMSSGTGEVSLEDASAASSCRPSLSCERAARTVAQPASAVIDFCCGPHQK